MFRAGSSRSIESTIQAVTSYYKPLQHGLVRSNIYLRIVFMINRIYLNTRDIRRYINTVKEILLIFIFAKITFMMINPRIFFHLLAIN